MVIPNTISLESNRQKEIDLGFNVDDSSYDGGLLRIKEFVAKIGMKKLVKQLFKTNATVPRIHTDPD